MIINWLKTKRTVNINMDTGIDELDVQKSTNIPQPQIRLDMIRV